MAWDEILRAIFQFVVIPFAVGVVGWAAASLRARAKRVESEAKAATERAEAVIEADRIKNAALELVQDRLVDVTNKFDTLTEKHLSIAVENASLQEQIKQLRTEVDRRVSESATNRDILTVQSSTIEDFKARIAALETEQTQQRAVLADLKKERDALKGELAQMQEERARLLREIADLRAELAKREGRESVLAEQITQLESSLQEKEAEIERISKRIGDDNPPEENERETP